MKRRDIIFTFLGFVLIIAIVICLSQPRLKRYAESISCGNTMVAIGFATQMWEEDNSNCLAGDFLSMSNELCTPKILICPSDKARKIAYSWGSFTTNNSSYKILRPNLSGNDVSNAYFRCTIHGYQGYADGSIFDGNRRITKW